MLCTSIDFLFSIQPNARMVYDIEVYPNVFNVTFYDPVTKQTWYFEISDFRNDLIHLCMFIEHCNILRCSWVGYNNVYYDYPVVHFIYKGSKAYLSAADIYIKSMAIIETPHNKRHAHVIWPRDQLVKQIDLYKIHHFDNMAKATSLKILEFNMRSERVESLPFPVGSVLSPPQVEKLAWYNGIDIRETAKFLVYSQSAITMRENLGEKFGLDFTNSSDVKIGEQILIHTLNERGIKTTVYIDDKKKKLQTARSEVILADIIFPYVNLERSEFQHIKDKLCNTVLTGTTMDSSIAKSAFPVDEISIKGVFKDLVANVDGIDYKFGTGGLHASVDAKIIRSDDRYQLVDVDVSSYYPNLAIKNSLYPEHLTAEFCNAYLEIYETRKSHPKGTPENEAYKLALNGSYGNSNNKYSSLYDPQYTMSITINGQLLLVMLIEAMLKIPGLKMIQANTDGITYLCPREYLNHTLTVIDWWEQLTKLELEEVHYESMYVRDVNSYIAVKEDGKIKRIGAYASETADINPGTRELPWHKDWSFRVVPIAAEAVLVHGKNLREFIENYRDVYHFFGRTKVPRSSKLHWGDKVVPNIVRYYVSNSGKRLTKVMPSAGTPGEFKRANSLTDEYFYNIQSSIAPGTWDARIHTKNKSIYEERSIGICTGYDTEIIERFDDDITVDYLDINYEFYVKETEKLINLMEYTP